MSRIGKKIIAIPKGVTVTATGDKVSVKGPKGELHLQKRPEVTVQVEGAVVKVGAIDDERSSRAYQGTARSLLAGMVIGVAQGYERKLEITGVGYRATMQGKNLQLALGYSHDVIYPIPEGISISVPKPTEITISGSDGQRVGQVAAEIRAFRPPEPYKGKGVKYVDEFIFRKEGKKK